MPILVNIGQGSGSSKGLNFGFTTDLCHRHYNYRATVWQPVAP